MGREILTNAFYMASQPNPGRVFGRIRTRIQERLISKGTRNANFVEGVDISSNRVPMIAYTDIGVTARFAQPGGNRVELFFGVKNLFDQPPPGTAISTSTSAPLTNFTLYDVLGRRFTLGLRFRR